MRQRINTLDGLRCLAAMGVLWIHTWTAHKNPRCYIGKIDLANFLAIGQNGVDLFFVISGFCMYYFYGSKSNFSYHDFFRFLFKRWVRLSPAFYAATLIYIIVQKFIYHIDVNMFLNMIHSLFYLDNILRGYVTASHFWTLTVEWQFYFTIPILLIYQNKIGFKNIFLIIFGLIFSTAVISVLIIKNRSDLLTGTIIFHGIEFGLGTVVAWLILNNYVLVKKRVLWLIAFVVITYTGRVFISKPIFDLSTYYYNLLRLLGFTLMGTGFAGILFLSITSTKWLDRFLGNKLFKKMGRMSYSFYLFHGLLFRVIAGYTISYLPFFTGIWAPVLSTCISAVILYPISLLSYNILEKPFLSIGNLTSK